MHRGHATRATLAGFGSPLKPPTAASSRAISLTAMECVTCSAERSISEYEYACPEPATRDSSFWRHHAAACRAASSSGFASSGLIVNLRSLYAGATILSYSESRDALLALDDSRLRWKSRVLQLVAIGQSSTLSTLAVLRSRP